jgi:hypothetical protein
MLHILVKVYQTTSYTEFNKLFELTELDMCWALSLVSRDVFPTPPVPEFTSTNVAPTGPIKVQV